MLPAKKYTPEDVIRIVRRRKWMILIPFAIGLALAPLLANILPEQYRSETLILVVPQRVPDAYVKSTVSQTVADRLPAISEQILSRSRLQRVIEELDLYAGARQRQVMEDVVQTMRNEHITLSINATDDDETLDSFRISYVSDDPQTAQKVTERLASMTIEQNTLDRSLQAESTNVFLEAQLEDAKRRLLEHEKKLEEYRRLHAGQLPTQLEGNLHAISSAQLQLQSLSESVNRARERRMLIERQIVDTQALPVVLPAGAASADAAMSTAQQLEVTRTRLENARLRFTPDHPDVRALERLMGELQAKLTEEAGAPQVAQERTLSPSEVAQQKKLRDLKSELDVVDLQLAALAQEESTLKRTIASYQSKVDILPTRESELVELTRDYETLDEGYRNLLAKWEESKIAANMERGQIGEQFRILDSASLPEKPFNEKQRLAVTFSGAVAGLLLGVLLIAYKEFFDASFKREEDVFRALNLPVLAMVPAVVSARDLQVQRHRALLENVAGIAVLLVSATVLVIWRL